VPKKPVDLSEEDHKKAVDCGFLDFLKDYICASTNFRNFFYGNFPNEIHTTKDFQNILGVRLYFLLCDMFLKRISKFFLSKISSQNELLTPKKIYFDFKHGWTLVSGKTRAFPGKVDIIDPRNLCIGRYSYFSGVSIIDGNGLVSIGSFCSIASDQHLFSSNKNHPHRYPSTFNFKSNSRMEKYHDNFEINFERDKFKIDEINIGNDVWIGINCTIMNGVIISNGCVIGANSTVTADTCSYGIYAGSPAKLIRYRFADDIINFLLDIEWWNWSLDKIKRNHKFFNLNLQDTTYQEVKGAIVP
jgi:acetyltransferase-like isoleucine patch superfamily enzyme